MATCRLHINLLVNKMVTGKWEKANLLLNKGMNMVTCELESKLSNMMRNGYR